MGMNYLSHFVYNHEIRGLAATPYFAMGVVLPDLWLRFSRRRRLRWRAVRAAEPMDPVGASLRAGLLNHVEVDRSFHGLPTFLLWQQALKVGVNGSDVHPALVDFVAHVAIELVMDHHLVRAAPARVERFYELLAGCDPGVVAQRVAVLGAVKTHGLEDVVRRFVERRFLRHYRAREGLADVVRILLALAQMPAVPELVLERVFTRAVRLVRPGAIWAALAEPRSVLAASAEVR
jgi:hypothetical protein